MNRLFTLVLLSILHFSFTASGQNFLWGRSGGGADTNTVAYRKETIADMATDGNGNVYILSQVLDTNLHIEGQALPTYGAEDILIASYSSAGVLRWSKIIGSSGTDIPGALRTDGRDGVYISSSLTMAIDSGHIDIDTVLAPTEKNIILIKYDTNGNLLWHKMPQSDTVTSYSRLKTHVIDMDVDPSGSTYWLCELPPGAYGEAGGLVFLSQSRDYVLKYDADGNFKGVNNIALYLGGASINQAYMTYDHRNQRFYVSGTNEIGGGVKIGANTLGGTMYVGCFNLNGAVVWHRQGGSNASGITGAGFGYRPAVDDDGNIYLSGFGRAAISSYPNDTFNGYMITHGSGNITPFIVKIDKNGNNVWARDAQVTGFTYGAALALRNSDEVILTGYNPDTLEWPGYNGMLTQTRTSTSAPGWNVFITRFDAKNGDVLGMDQISSNDGASEFSSCMVSDNKGNVYLGGSFTDEMYVNSLSHIQTSQGLTDWFLVKYGNMWPDNVNSFISDKEVVIYPNPAQDHINISHAGVGTRLQLNDMAGRNLYTQVLTSDFDRIDLTNYPSGNYIIQLTDKNGGSLTKKIAKQ